MMNIFAYYPVFSRWDLSLQDRTHTRFVSDGIVNQIFMIADSEVYCCKSSKEAFYNFSPDLTRNIGKKLP